MSKMVYLQMKKQLSSGENLQTSIRIIFITLARRKTSGKWEIQAHVVLAVRFTSI
jgi:hypothetical protein